MFLLFLLYIILAITNFIIIIELINHEESKKHIQRIIVNTCNSGAESVQDLDTNFGRRSGIMEDQNKVIGDTHELTE